MEDFKLYLMAIAANYKWLLAGGPYFLEGLVKRALPDGWKKLDARWPPSKRKPVEIAVMLLGVFLAGFFSWKDEHDKVISLQSMQKPTNIITRKMADDLRVRVEASGKNFSDNIKEYGIIIAFTCDSYAR